MQKGSSQMKVVVRFSDGLGNQLFQFALGRYVEDILDCDLFSDETHFIVSEIFRGKK